MKGTVALVDTWPRSEIQENVLQYVEFFCFTSSLGFLAWTSSNCPSWCFFFYISFFSSVMLSHVFHAYFCSELIIIKAIVNNHCVEPFIFTHIVVLLAPVFIQVIHFCGDSTNLAWIMRRGARKWFYVVLDRSFGVIRQTSHHQSR
jgi:hypothetical protein